MANPRRSSYSSTNTPHPTTPTSETQQTHPSSQFLTLTSLIHFLKKPHAFPFLLSVFLLLTWVSLRLQHVNHVSSSQSQQPHHQDTQKLKRSDDDDEKANLARFTSAILSAKDKRGWLLDPVKAANDAGLPGGALSCFSAHLGQIQPGGMRGNHRHYTCNETFIIWGAQTKFRLENMKVAKGYAEVTIGEDEVGVACSPSGTAHALVNVDPIRTSYFLGCQDKAITYNNSTDFKVWKDLT